MKQVTSTHKLIGFGGNIVQLAKHRKHETGSLITRHAGGRNPRALNKRRPITQAKKTSEPLPHPYIGVLCPYRNPCESRSEQVGTYFPCALACRQVRGFFLTPVWNSLSLGVEPRTWGVLLRPPNQSTYLGVRKFKIQMQLYSHSFIRHDKSNSCLAIFLVLMQILKVRRVNCDC